jgi:hypothetical protein
MQGLLFAVYNKQWETFQFSFNKCWRYFSGWHVFAALRAFIEAEWKEGMSMFLNLEAVYWIMIAMPSKNRKDLIHNMKQYSYLKARKLELSEIIEESLELIEGKITKYYEQQLQINLTA